MLSLTTIITHLPEIGLGIATIVAGIITVIGSVATYIVITATPVTHRKIRKFINKYVLGIYWEYK